MSLLAKLTITQLKRPALLSPQEQRRAKLVAKLQEQLALLDAQAAGTTLQVTRPAWAKDEQGNRIRVQKPRAVRAWWWQDGAALCMVVRYGARPLELTKGKRAIAVADISKLPDVINTLIAAVQAGELDAAIDAAVGARKLNLSKTT